MLKTVCLAFVVAAAAYGSIDPHCPRYPESAYVQAEEFLELQQEAARFSKRLSGLRSLIGSM